MAPQRYASAIAVIRCFRRRHAATPFDAAIMPLYNISLYVDTCRAAAVTRHMLLTLSNFSRDSARDAAGAYIAVTGHALCYAMLFARCRCLMLSAERALCMPLLMLFDTLRCHAIRRQAC